LVASKKERKTSIHLARIQQQWGEDLKGYVRRFNHEVVLILDLQDGVAYIAFLNGLLPGRFKFSLAESKVTTLVEALGRAQSFIQPTEICASEESLRPDSKKRVVEDRNVQSNKRHKSTNERGGGRFHASPRDILMEIKGSPMLRRPTPIGTPINLQNRNKYCEYHEDCNHTTSECRELKKALHEMADRGQLNRFVQHGSRPNPNKSEASRKKQRDTDQDTEVIATISGGFNVKELSAGYRKAQVRQLSQAMAARGLRPLTGPTRTFGPEDLRPLQAPHDDPLVVQLKIAAAMVRRVLIDTGSSVDIITLECFRKLQYTEKDLEAAGTPLVGFEGQPTYPVGMKKLGKG